jgi:hypothetical protein
MPSAEDRAEAKRIAGEIAKIGFVLPGSVTKRYLTCTHQGCRCHGEPPRLHGPYWYWTRKVNGKTVTKSLREEQVEDYCWRRNCLTTVRHDSSRTVRQCSPLTRTSADR